MRKERAEQVLRDAAEALRMADNYEIEEADCAHAFGKLYASALMLGDALVIGLAHTALLLDRDYVSDERDMTRVMAHMVERLELLLTVAT